jgi:hypothetical protein
MKQYTITLNKEYIFDVYEDRYQVVTEKPTIVVYLKRKDRVYKKTLCEFVDNPKSYLHDNPPVNESLSNDIFLLLQRDDTEIHDNLRRYYIGTVSRFNEYFKNNDIEID